MRDDNQLKTVESVRPYQIDSETDEKAAKIEWSKRNIKNLPIPETAGRFN